MTQFHEGQEVEVYCIIGAPGRLQFAYDRAWRKAKILTVSRPNEPPQTASVIFPDGSSGVFDAEHIREVSPLQFHEGQEVEVLIDPAFPTATFAWRKAKIVNSIWHVEKKEFRYRVQFPDGSRAVFDEEHIRACAPRIEYGAFSEDRVRGI